MKNDATQFIHPQILGNIAQSEIEGGVFLKDLQPGTKLAVQTKNTRYEVEVVDPAKGRVKIQ